jgi:hypothetical protein
LILYPDYPNIGLVFKALSAGYGQHLFNELLVILFLQIAVFELALAGTTLL